MTVRIPEAKINKIILIENCGSLKNIRKIGSIMQSAIIWLQKNALKRFVPRADFVTKKSDAPQLNIETMPKIMPIAICMNI
jgi:hypothetical protein